MNRTKWSRHDAPFFHHREYLAIGRPLCAGPEFELCSREAGLLAKTPRLARLLLAFATRKILIGLVGAAGIP